MKNTLKVRGFADQTAIIPALRITAAPDGADEAPMMRSRAAAMKNISSRFHWIKTRRLFFSAGGAVRGLCRWET